MLLASAAKRVALAQKIYKSENLEERTSNNNNWFVKAAKDADLDLDEDWIDEGQAGGDERERQKFKEAEKAKGELKELLRQPIVRQKFGKFISGAGAKKQIDLQKKEEEGGQGGGGGGAGIGGMGVVNEKDVVKTRKNKKKKKKLKKEEGVQGKV